MVGTQSMHPETAWSSTIYLLGESKRSMLRDVTTGIFTTSCHCRSFLVLWLIRLRARAALDDADGSKEASVEIM